MRQQEVLGETHIKRRERTNGRMDDEGELLELDSGSSASDATNVARPSSSLGKQLCEGG